MCQRFFFLPVQNTRDEKIKFTTHTFKHPHTRTHITQIVHASDIQSYLVSRKWEGQQIKKKAGNLYLHRREYCGRTLYTVYWEQPYEQNGYTLYWHEFNVTISNENTSSLVTLTNLCVGRRPVVAITQRVQNISATLTRADITTAAILESHSLSQWQEALERGARLTADVIDRLKRHLHESRHILNYERYLSNPSC